MAFPGIKLQALLWPRVGRALVRGGPWSGSCSTRRGRWQPRDSHVPYPGRPSGRRGGIPVFINVTICFSLRPLIFFPLWAPFGEGGASVVAVLFYCSVAFEVSVIPHLLA